MNDTRPTDVLPENLTHCDPQPTEPQSQLRIATQQTKTTVVTLDCWPESDPCYTRVLFRIPAAGVEVWLSSTDAQRLGHALNNAGGGTLS